MTGVYIHIPYCHSKCAYCDFYSMPWRTSSPGADDRLAELARLIAREWAMRRDECDEPLSTLYVGGGTPSIMPIDDLAVIIRALGDKQDWDEATIECNPEDVTPRWIADIRSLGFTRVSMGIQSFHDDELRLIGRRHTADDAVTAATLLIDSGLDVSLDLIYGLPGQTLQMWRDNLERMLDLRPSHLSAYLLSYEPGTRLSAMLQAGKIEETPAALAGDMYDTLCELTHAAGYRHYEISNFSLPGHKALHNSRYWSGHPYIGLGPSAHSFDGTTRRVNPQSIRQYSEAIKAGALPYVIDDEDDNDRLNDIIITRLRHSDGLDTDEIRARHGAKALADVMADARPLIDRGLLTLDHGILRIPERHWLTSDAIMRDLIQL